MGTRATQSILPLFWCLSSSCWGFWESLSATSWRGKATAVQLRQRKMRSWRKRRMKRKIQRKEVRVCCWNLVKVRLHILTMFLETAEDGQSSSQTNDIHHAIPVIFILFLFILFYIFMDHTISGRRLWNLLARIIKWPLEQELCIYFFINCVSSLFAEV